MFLTLFLIKDVTLWQLVWSLSHIRHHMDVVVADKGVKPDDEWRAMKFNTVVVKAQMCFPAISAFTRSIKTTGL